jgi:hypothetical protein
MRRRSPASAVPHKPRQLTVLELAKSQEALSFSDSQFMLAFQGTHAAYRGAGLVTTGQNKTQSNPSR